MVVKISPKLSGSSKNDLEPEHRFYRRLCVSEVKSSIVPGSEKGYLVKFEEDSNRYYVFEENSSLYMRFNRTGILKLGTGTIKGLNCLIENYTNVAELEKSLVFKEVRSSVENSRELNTYLLKTEDSD